MDNIQSVKEKSKEMSKIDDMDIFLDSLTKVFSGFNVSLSISNRIGCNSGNEKWIAIVQCDEDNIYLSPFKIEIYGRTLYSVLLDALTTLVEKINSKEGD